MKNTPVYFALIIYILLTSCNTNKKNNIESDNHFSISNDSAQIKIKYAQGFTVKYLNDIKLIDIKDPQGENETVYRYALAKKGQNKELIPKEYTVIETPINNLICMTTLQLANFIKLDAIDKVIGMTSTHYLFNEQMKERIKNKQAWQIGIEGNFDNELILALNPDIILVSPFKRGGYESIRDLDIPLVTFLGYKETTPLGQAEWLKFAGMLLGEEEKADSLFEEIENKYNELLQLCKSIKTPPIVLSGEMRSGNWYVVGGKSYLAQQFRDAGAEYFLTNNEETGGLHLDFESVYSQGANADFWRLLVSHTGDYSYEVLKSNDMRYADFKAFKEKKVVYCNLRQKPFYEKAPVEPEVVLADLIKAFHPELLPNYTPVYYEILTKEK